MHPIQAFKAFFRVLVQGEQLLPPPPPATAFQPSREQAVQLLALLQKDGRLVDFLMEEISAFSDAQIGAAVRPIHASTRKALLERVKLARIHDSPEGSTVTLPEGFDPSRYALTGNPGGGTAQSGVLRHRGWVVTELNLPTVPAEADPLVVAPAEVDVR
ncbi:MAG: DUF2760 domain-containing protein [Candidatus Sumerlaeia bacterium]|nr:DUF2760 domain-containing protein [Candidatus Sumerlaeia bacterium]